MTELRNLPVSTGTSPWRSLRDEAYLLQARFIGAQEGLLDLLDVVLPYLDALGGIQLRGVYDLLGDEGPVPPVVADAADESVSHQSSTS